MDKEHYPDGVYDFRELVSGQYCFVDKTMMIRHLCRLSN